MKFANVDGQRQEAQPHLRGECLVCGGATIAKCGEKNIWHWAHKAKRKCDSWWESETEWHRKWKNHFPVKWQEGVCWADDGEKHVADVKTDQDLVIEFQHSHINPVERRSREAFYGSMVWVVDGRRRKRDLKQFNETVRDHGLSVSQQPLIMSIFPMFSRLFMEWFTSSVPVFVDFGEDIGRHDLWLLIPTNSDSQAYIALIGKEDFVDCCRKGGFNSQPIFDKIKSYNQRRARASVGHYASQWMSKRPRRTPRF